MCSVDRAEIASNNKVCGFINNFKYVFYVPLNFGLGAVSYTHLEIYYYVCSRNRMVRGKHCEYKAMLKKTDIEPMVIEAIREIVRNEEYAQAIKDVYKRQI